MIRIAMPANDDHMRKESTRAWLSGLAITLTTIVAYFAFWHLSPGVTFVIGRIALFGLLISFWVSHKR
jgi:hypothetical protein